jgi:hypothetical protein
MNTAGSLPEALIAEGWTSTGNNGAAGQEERCRELTSPDGLLTVWVSASPSGSSILLTAKVVNRAGMRRRDWQAQFDRLPGRSRSPRSRQPAWNRPTRGPPGPSRC